MVKSIQIYRFTKCPEISKLRLKLGNSVSIKRSMPDRNTVNTNIDLKCKLHFIQEDSTPGIGGKIDFEFQAKIRQSREHDEYTIFEEYYYFYIIPKFKIIIIHGSSSHRNQVRNALFKWFKKFFKDITFETIYFSKETVKKIVDSIKKDHLKKNDIKKPYFFYDRKKDHRKMEDLTYDMYSGVCASDNPSFNNDFAKASNWDVKMRIFKCTGILPEPVVDEFILDIYHDARFTFSKNPNQIEWNRFVIEKCLFALTK